MAVASSIYEGAMTTSLYDRFFQFGYVTRDGDAATAQFNKRFGPVEWQFIAGNEANPHTKRIALTYRDGVMVEIIEVNDKVPSIYRDFLPSSPVDIRFHHLGYLIDDYKATLARVKADGYDVPMAVTYGEVLDCCYVDTRAQLGHYLEYVRLGEEGRKWFASVPGFRSFP
jgi:hypothetical protein